MTFKLESSNNTVLIVYELMNDIKMVEFCGCLNMDLPAPRSFEEAREIQQRGQLKYGYFTNFIRLRIEYILRQKDFTVKLNDFLYSFKEIING